MNHRSRGRPAGWKPIARAGLRLERALGELPPWVGLPRLLGGLGLTATIVGVATWPLVPSSSSDQARAVVLAGGGLSSIVMVLAPARWLSRATSHLAVATALIIETAYVLTTGAMASPFQAGYAPIVIVAGLFASSRMALATAASAVVGLAAVAVVGGFHAPHVATILIVGSSNVAVGFVTALLADVNRRYRDHLHRRLVQSQRRATVQETASRTDGLTGLWNRRVFDRDLAAMLAGSGTPETVFLAIADADGLKAVNDSAGHLAGDAMLRAVADALRSAVRFNDRVYRIGGDEFAVLAITRDPRVLTERLGDHAYGEVPGVGVVEASIGIAVSEPGDAPVDLMARADAQLYQAKTRRRRGPATLPVASDKTSLPRPSEVPAD